MRDDGCDAILSAARAGAWAGRGPRNVVRELMEIARLRAQGVSRLAAIAEENGADSVLYRRCRELWFDREAGADLSIVSGDWKNASTLLQLGLHVLLHGPDALKKDGLALDDVVKLLGAA